MAKRLIVLLVILCAFVAPAFAQDKPTYAERLGFPKGARVVLFHNDDAGCPWGKTKGQSRRWNSD